MDEKQIIESVLKLQEGNKEALTEIYNAYENQLYFYLKNYIKNESDLKDVLQNTFISVFQSIDKLETPSAFNGWVYKIAYRRAMDFHRKNQKSDILLEEDQMGMVDAIEEDSTEFLPSEALESDETKHYVAGLIKELADEQKTAILLYYYKQMSISQISELMGCAEGTIKSRLNYARKYIKTKIEEKQKKGYKVIAVFPLPILTQLLLWEAEQTKLSADASAAVLNGVKDSLGLSSAGGSSAGATVSASIKTAGMTATTKAVAIFAVIGLVATGVIVGAMIHVNSDIQNTSQNSAGENITTAINAGDEISLHASDEENVEQTWKDKAKKIFLEYVNETPQQTLASDQKNGYIEYIAMGLEKSAEEVERGELAAIHSSAGEPGNQDDIQFFIDLGCFKPIAYEIQQQEDGTFVVIPPSEEALDIYLDEYLDYLKNNEVIIDKISVNNQTNMDKTWKDILKEDLLQSVNIVPQEVLGRDFTNGYVEFFAFGSAKSLEELMQGEQQDGCIQAGVRDDMDDINAFIEWGYFKPIPFEIKKQNDGNYVVVPPSDEEVDAYLSDYLEYLKNIKK